MARESEEEGFDGYSPCCNEPIELTTETHPPTYETQWPSWKAAQSFLQTHGLSGALEDTPQGKGLARSILPPR